MSHICFSLFQSHCPILPHIRKFCHCTFLPNQFSHWCGLIFLRYQLHCWFKNIHWQWFSGSNTAKSSINDKYRIKYKVIGLTFKTFTIWPQTILWLYVPLLHSLPPRVYIFPKLNVPCSLWTQCPHSSSYIYIFHFCSFKAEVHFHLLTAFTKTLQH